MAGRDAGRQRRWQDETLAGRDAGRQRHWQAEKLVAGRDGDR